MDKKKEKNIKKNKKISLSMYIKIFVFIFFLANNLNIIENMILFTSYIDIQRQFSKIENNLEYCKNKFRELQPYRRVKNPKISIISPLLNKERYLLRFLRSIQYQNFNSLEIIFIDDYSKDNSVKIIGRNYGLIDKRIRIITNRVNKGVFYSRNLGVLYSRGKYIILPDADDILSHNILNLCYLLMEKYNYDMIRYNTYLGEEKLYYGEILDKLKYTPIFQPELSTYMYYGNNNELEMIDGFIHNKFMKREVFIKALNDLNDKNYLNNYILYLDDQIMNHVLYRTAKSFFFLRKIGYYYLPNSISITKNLMKYNELRLKFIFIYLKIAFEYSKNTKYERDMANIVLTILTRNFNVQRQLSAITDEYYFYYDILNMYLDNLYITDENKYMLQDFKYEVERKINRTLIQKNITANINQTSLLSVNNTIQNNNVSYNNSNELLKNNK